MTVVGLRNFPETASCSGHIGTPSSGRMAQSTSSCPHLVKQLAGASLRCNVRCRSYFPRTRALRTSTLCTAAPEAPQSAYSVLPENRSYSGRLVKEEYAQIAYLTGRTKVITQHFPQALGIDDFIGRVEIALFAYGFTGENSIGKALGFSQTALHVNSALPYLVCRILQNL